jgi:hypothetical protein
MAPDMPRVNVASSSAATAKLRMKLACAVVGLGGGKLVSSFCFLQSIIDQFAGLAAQLTTTPKAYTVAV